MWSMWPMSPTSLIYFFNLYLNDDFENDHDDNASDVKYDDKINVKNDFIKLLTSNPRNHYITGNNIFAFYRYTTSKKNIYIFPN